MASPRALSIARTAERFGQSPSRAYLGLGDPVMVTLVDEALALRLAADDARIAAGRRGRAPVGTADVDPGELRDPGPVDEPQPTADSTGHDPLAGVA